MPTDLTLLFALSAYSEAASTLQAFAALGLPGTQSASGSAGVRELRVGAGGLNILSQHKRPNEMTMASRLAARSCSLHSAPLPLCTAIRPLAVSPRRVSRRRH